ncbi:MAG: DUF1640 domain-containing protein [Gammaproteobacteria bacterium]|nr:DUF1640 domain-containing protein [Gammaproteobacteria bacterium]
MPDNASAPEDPQRVAEAQASYREDFDPAVAGVHAFDRLQKADFTPDQAESVVLTVRELVGDLATKNDIVRLEANMATKDDLVALRTEMARLGSALRTEMAGGESALRTEMAGLESALKTEMAGGESALKTEMAGLESALKTEITESKNELRTEMAGLKSELKTEIKDSIHKSIFWTIGIIVGTLLAGMGIATTVIIAAMMRLVA